MRSRSPIQKYLAWGKGSRPGIQNEKRCFLIILWLVYLNFHHFSVSLLWSNRSWIYWACSELPGHHINCSESCYDAINFLKYSAESPQITECFTSTVMWQKGQAWYPSPHTNPINFTATPRTVATKRKKCNLLFEVTDSGSSFIHNLVLLKWCGSLNTNTIWLSLNAFYINVA